jgi:hypothetical protein
MTAPIVTVRSRKPLPAHKRCDIGSITKVVQQNQEGENWKEHVIYNKLIMQQIAHFLKHTLRNHGRSITALLRVSIETVNYGKGLCMKKDAKHRGKAYKVQSRRKNNFSTASTIIGAHIKYYTNLNSLAFPPGRSGFNPK